MTPLEALEELGCVGTRKQLLAMGVRPAAIATALVNRQVTRVRHGKYAARDGAGLLIKAEAFGGVVSQSARAASTTTSHCASQTRPFVSDA